LRGSTGYIQRKLVKILEDIKVEYDGTVRNANDKIIQCVYGDSGINTEKQILTTINLISANNKTIGETYVYSKSELDELRKKHQSEKYTSEINDKLYRKLISMRNQLRIIQRKTNLMIVDFKEKYMVPVDIEQYVTNIISKPDRNQNQDIVDPYYVVTKIKEMYSGGFTQIMKYNISKSKIKKLDDKRIKFIMKIHLFDVLSPKKCTHKYQLSKLEFDSLVEFYRESFKLAKIEAGEMVGFVAAHGIGEPVTQSNLKSFHKAGSGTAAALTGGLPRVRELLSMTKNIKRPITTIILEDKYKNDKMIANKIASHLKYTVVQDVIDKVDVVYDPKPYDKHSLMSDDKVTNIFEVSQGKSGCQSEIKGLPWVVRLTLSKEKMMERNITMLEFKTAFCRNWAERYEDAKTTKKEYKKIIDKITQCAIVSNYDNSPIPIVHVRFSANNYNLNTLIQFQEMVVTKFHLKGIPGIMESNNVAEESYTAFEPDGTMVKKKQWIINTVGVNLQDLTQINGINLEETRCNDIVAIYEMYGCECLRASFVREFTKSIESSGGECNYAHIELLADCISHMGGMIAVNRHGANKLDTDPFSRASFEKTVEQMLSAATFSESDHLRSTSGRIMAGLLINGGTGSFDLLLNHIKIKKAFKPSAEIVPEQKIIKKSSVVNDLIKKKIGK
jgi:DNA-directed RNA polymerase II subunit RPB1